MREDCSGLRRAVVVDTGLGFGGKDMVESCALVSVPSVAGVEGHTWALVSVSGLVFNGVLKGDLKGCESVRDALSSRRRFDGCRCVMVCSKSDGEHSLDQLATMLLASAFW